MSNTTASNNPLPAPAAAAATPVCNMLEGLRATSFDQLMVTAGIVYEEAMDQLNFTLLSIMNENSTDSLTHRLAEAIYYQDGHNLVMHYRIGDTTRLQQEHEAVAAGIGSQEEVGRMSDFTLMMQLSAWVNSVNAERLAQWGRDNNNRQESEASSSSSSPNNNSNHDSGYGSRESPQGGDFGHELSDDDSSSDYFPSDGSSSPDDSSSDESSSDHDSKPTDKDPDNNNDEGGKEKGRLYVDVYKKDLGRCVRYAY
jgi:hypothetical protein